MNSSDNLPSIILPQTHHISRSVSLASHSGLAEPEASGSVPLSHYFWIIRRNGFKILGFVAICVLTTVIASLRMTPIYEAVATVDIDRQSPPGIIGEESTRSALNDTDQFLATQMKLIQSNAVLRPVVRQYRLLEHEDKNASSDPVETAKRSNAPFVLKNLKVTRPPNTYLVLVSYRSPDPQLAANVANAVTQSYIAHTFDLRFRESASLSTFMEKQIEELRAKVERSSGALAKFEKELNVINPEEKTSILSARLLQLNTEFTNAQADRVRKESEARAISGNSMDAALASQQGESLRKLLDHLNEVNEKFVQTGGQYGVNHPEYRKAALDVAEVKRALEMMRRSIAERVNSELRQSQGREAILAKVVFDTKAEFDRLNANSFAYQQLKREAEGDKQLYDVLVRRIKEASINASFQNSSIRLADAAGPPIKPISPSIPLNAILAFIFSMLLSVGTAVLVDVLDITVRDPDKAARDLNVAILGSLPIVRNWRRNSVAVMNASKESDQLKTTEYGAVSQFTESARTLRNSILLADFDRRLRTVLVTSASPGDGKSTIAAHLAIAHAEQGKKTLLIDADLRRPSVHRKFGFTSAAGLSTVLLGDIEWPKALVRPEHTPNLDILPAGPTSRRATDLIGGEMSSWLDEASSEYDLVIVDAPPLLGFAEALRMATSVDGVLIVARAGKTNRKAVGSVVNTLNRLRVNILGLVMNEVKRDSSDSYYYYGSYGKYYAASDLQKAEI